MNRAKIRFRIVDRAKRSQVLQAVWSVWRRFTRPSHTVCESVLEWALTTPGASAERMRPASTVHRQLPNTLDATVHEFFASFPRSYVVPEKYIARVSGGRIVVREGLLVLPDGSFSVESIYERRHLLEAPSFRKRLPHNETFYPGNYFSLLIKFVTDSNYYHWLHDGVIRLHEVIERLPADTRFVVPARRRPFQDEALDLVGVTPDRLCELGDSGVARFENLYFAPPSAPSGVDSTEADVWFRECALSAYGITLGPPSRRIYISRRGASYRRITNGPEVEALLRELGFEIHELEQYSLNDQVALFAEAEVVVSAHGAGLTNMLFSPPGLVVVDIFESTRFNKCFWSMSTALGHRYWYLIGDTVPSGTTFAGDIRVSLGALREVVSAAMTGSASAGGPHLESWK